MIKINANNEDYDFFLNLQKKYDDINIVTGKGLDGSADIVEIIIQLTPTVLLNIAIIVHEIVSYMKEKKKQERIEKTENPSKITVKKKSDNGEFEIILESDQIDDINATTNRIVKMINKP